MPYFIYLVACTIVGGYIGSWWGALIGFVAGYLISWPVLYLVNLLMFPKNDKPIEESKSEKKYREEIAKFKRGLGYDE